jgi:hypothetical protein
MTTKRLVLETVGWLGLLAFAVLMALVTIWAETAGLIEGFQ